MIVIYHGKNIKTQKHTYTLYSHLFDNRALRKGGRVKEGQLVGFVGNTGTRADFDKKDRGYKLHFEVLESKKELRSWRMRLAADYGSQNQRFRKDPEGFLKSSFKAVFAGDLVKEALDRLKKEKLDISGISELVGKWAEYATESGYVGVTVAAPVYGPLGPKVGAYYNLSDETAYVSFGVGLFTSPSVNVVYSPDELATVSRGAYAGPIDISESFESIPGPNTLEFNNSRKGVGIYFEITLPVPPGPTQPFNFHQFGRL